MGRMRLGSSSWLSNARLIIFHHRKVLRLLTFFTAFQTGVIKSNSSQRLEFVSRFNLSIKLSSILKRKNNNYRSTITKKKKGKREETTRVTSVRKYPYCGGIIDTSRPMVKFKPAESTIIPEVRGGGGGRRESTEATESKVKKQNYKINWISGGRTVSGLPSRCICFTVKSDSHRLLVYKKKEGERDGEGEREADRRAVGCDFEI